MDNTQLPALMQRLPLELFEHIYDLVFANDGEANAVRLIDRSYRPPVRLQVDSLSREAYAKQYYGGCSIIALDRRYQLAWARSLTTSHFNNIRRIRYPHLAGNFVPGPTDGWKTSTLRKIGWFETLLGCFGYELLGRKGVLARKLAFVTEDDDCVVIWKVEYSTLGVTFTKIEGAGVGATGRRRRQQICAKLRCT